MSVGLHIPEVRISNYKCLKLQILSFFICSVTQSNVDKNIINIGYTKQIIQNDMIWIQSKEILHWKKMTDQKI